MTSSDASTAGPSPRRPSLTCYPDGPVLVRGEVDLFGPDGALLPRRRRTVALCRCGHSALAPWCDGTHKQVRGGTWRQREPSVGGTQVPADEQDERDG